MSKKPTLKELMDFNIVEDLINVYIAGTDTRIFVGGSAEFIVPKKYEDYIVEILYSSYDGDIDTDSMTYIGIKNEKSKD